MEYDNGIRNNNIAQPIGRESSELTAAGAPLHRIVRAIGGEAVAAGRRGDVRHIHLGEVKVHCPCGGGVEARKGRHLRHAVHYGLVAVSRDVSVGLQSDPVVTAAIAGIQHTSVGRPCGQSCRTGGTRQRPRRTAH